MPFLQTHSILDKVTPGLWEKGRLSYLHSKKVDFRTTISTAEAVRAGIKGKEFEPRCASREEQTYYHKALSETG